MGSIGIIARRLPNGKVQYGCSGCGSYFKETGRRLLDWYDEPELVDYLFSLGQLSMLGLPGSEINDEHWYFKHRLAKRAHSIGRTEREMFSRMLFVSDGYFYDIDQKWYRVDPGPFRIKIPLEYIRNITEDGEIDEHDYLTEIEREIIRRIFTAYRESDPKFQELLDTNGINAEAILKELPQWEAPVMNIYDNFRIVYSYFDDWVLAITDDEDEKILDYIIKPKKKKHIETIKWYKGSQSATSSEKQSHTDNEDTRLPKKKKFPHKCIILNDARKEEFYIEYRKGEVIGKREVQKECAHKLLKSGKFDLKVISIITKLSVFELKLLQYSMDKT